MTIGRAPSSTADAITGVADGVPFLAVPPEGGPGTSSATVVAWHLLDPPRTEAAMAAALPLDGLVAWRIYLGLPMSGARMPAGGPDELMRLGYEDAVLNLQGPISDRAAAEFEPALAELRLGSTSGPGPSPWSADRSERRSPPSSWPKARSRSRRPSS